MENKSYYQKVGELVSSYPPITPGSGGSETPGTRSTNNEVLTYASDASIGTDLSTTVNLMCKELYTALGNLKSLNDRLAELQGLDREPMHSPIYNININININPRPNSTSKKNTLGVFLRTDVWLNTYRELKRLNTWDDNGDAIFTVWEASLPGHNVYIVSFFRSGARFYSVVNERGEHEKARKLGINLPDWIELEESGDDEF